MFLLMKFFNVSAWRNLDSIQLSGSSHQKVFLSRPFGNLGIGIWTLTSSLELALASALQKNCFCLQNFLNRIFMFFFVLTYGIRTTLLQILISLRFPIHVSKSIDWSSKKRQFGSICPLVFWKNNCSENLCILCILSRETSRLEFFLSRLAGFPGVFPKSSSEQLFCRETFSACRAFARRNSTAKLSKEFSRIL